MRKFNGSLGAFLLSYLLFVMPCLAQEYVPGEVIVKLKGERGSLLSHAFIGKVESEKMMTLKGSFNRFNLHHFSLKPGHDVYQAINEIKKDPTVEYAEPNFILKKQDANENGMELQRYSALEVNSYLASPTVSQTKADIKIQQAWTVASQTDFRPIVAVIDTGADINHEVFVGTEAIWVNEKEIPANGIDDDRNGYIDDVNGWNFLNDTNSPYDDDGHGTHVSGIILGSTQDIFSGKYEKSKIRIMPLKFLGKDGEGTTADAIRAIHYAVDNGAQVLNNSWGGEDYSAALQEAIAYSYENKVAFIAACGNSGNDNDKMPIYPASFDVPHIVSVAAINDWDRLASFSNYGSKSVDLGSPGVAILSTYPRNTFGYSSGTSMATPFVSGVAALMIRDNPELTGYDVKQYLRQSVQKVSYLSGKVVTGGKIDAFNSVVVAHAGGTFGHQPQYTATYQNEDDSSNNSDQSSSGGCGIVTTLIKSNQKNPPWGFLIGILIIPLVVVRFFKESTVQRRRHTRYQIQSSVTIHVDGQELVGSVSSISLGGAQVNTEALLKQGGIVSMKISSPDGSQEIDVKGEIVWSAKDKSYGVQFKDVEEGALGSISQWTQKLIKAH